jgi:hypothetical protein
MARVSFADAHIWQICSLGLLLTNAIGVLDFDQASASLLLFTFFMITDPKTPPERRGARMLIVVLVAVGPRSLRVVPARSQLMEKRHG